MTFLACASLKNRGLNSFSSLCSPTPSYLLFEIEGEGDKTNKRNEGLTDAAMFVPFIVLDDDLSKSNKMFRKKVNKQLINFVVCQSDMFL